MYSHILIPTDGSPLSAQAVDQGLALASKLGAKVTLMMVLEGQRMLAVAPAAMLESAVVDYEQRLREHAATVLAAATEKGRALGVACDSAIVVGDHAYEAIIDTARKRGADLITMASHGRRGLSGLVLGSETVKVLTHSSVPVLVYRQPSSK